MTPDWHRQGAMALEYSHFPNSHYTKKLMNDYLTGPLVAPTAAPLYGRLGLLQPHSRFGHGENVRRHWPREGFHFPKWLRL